MALRGEADEREDLTDAFLRLLGAGEVDGARVAEDLRARTATPGDPGRIEGEASSGLRGRLGTPRPKVNGYTVARRLRKLMKDQATPAA
jgi:hypothetical protein